MHVLFEGVCSLLLKLLLQHTECFQRYLTTDLMNFIFRLASFRTKVAGWQRMMPRNIDKGKLLDMKTLKQDSSQTCYLLMHLPSLIALVVPQVDDHWFSFTLLQQIVSMHNLTVAKMYKGVSQFQTCIFLFTFRHRWDDLVPHKTNGP